MAAQYEIIVCPFCHSESISCRYFPSATKIKIRSTATFGRNTRRVKSAEVWIVQSGCDKCGKSLEDVEKKLKDDGIIG